jgi:hypothetical protein
MLVNRYFVQIAPDPDNPARVRALSVGRILGSTGMNTLLCRYLSAGFDRVLRVDQMTNLLLFDTLADVDTWAQAEGVTLPVRFETGTRGEALNPNTEEVPGAQPSADDDGA